MNEKIFNHIKQYNESKGWGVTEKDIIETLQESDSVWMGEADKHRWYNVHTRVVCLNGMFIGFTHYETTGDDSPSDMGLSFKKESVKEYEPKEKTITFYEPKN